MTKKQLFGGTLMAAGLTTAAAAQSFTIGAQPVGNYVGAYLGGFIPFAIAGFYDQSAASGTAYARSQGSAPSITQFADSGDTGLAYTIHFNNVPFQVTADTTVTVSWDFTGDNDGPGGSYIDSYISVDGPNGNLAFGDLSNPVDSVQVALTAGEQYSFRGTALATDGGVSMSGIVIPAPASLALLGLGGLVAARRRR